MSEAEKFGKEMEITALGNQDNDRRFYLYPEVNYAFHRVLYDIWDVELESNDTIKSAIIEPTIFSVSRSFHWFGVAKWDASLHAADDRQVNPNEIITAIRKEKDYWKEFCDNVLRCHLPVMRKRTQKAAAYISGYVDSGKPILENEWVTAFKHLLSLHSGYHHDPELYLDGIVLRNLEKLHQERSHSIRIDYMQGDLEESDEPHLSYVKYPWARVKFFCKHTKLCLLEPYQCQELNKAGERPSDLTPEEVNQIKHRSGFSVATTLLNEIYFKHVPSAHDGKKKAFIVIPIYDVWIESEAWGSLCGNLLLFFAQRDSEGNGVTPALYDRLIDKTRLLSAEFYKSGLNLLLAQPIVPPYDLIEHFLKHIQIIQDWDRVIVYRGTVPQYCYYWEKKGSGNRNDSEWLRCGYRPGTFSQSLCGQCFQWNETSESKNGALRTPNSEKPKKEFLRWERDDIWSDQFLSDISEEEKQTFGDIRLVFEYPITACIPEKETKRKMLDEEYIRQQLEVLRGLIPKVRARRAALRNAAVSIIGRNMSHNIGSHVLARYVQTTGMQEKEVRPFLRYLQERMDFIAEMTTTDFYCALPTWFYRDCILALAGEDAVPKGLVREANNEVTEDSKIKGQSVLLQYITGVEGLRARIQSGDRDKADDFRFSCPGGRTGMHALYVILENIIRNTAKHSSSGPTPVRITPTWGREENGLVSLTLTRSRPPDDGEQWTLKCENPLSCREDQINGGLSHAEANIVQPLLAGGEEQNNNKEKQQSKEVPEVPNGQKLFTDKEVLSVTIPQDKKKGSLTVSVSVSKDLSVNVLVKEVENEDSDYYEVLIWDNKHNGCAPVEGETKAVKLYEHINKSLSSPLIDDAGVLDPNAWGIRELFLAAAYLREVPMKELESPDNWPVLEDGMMKPPNGTLPILEALAVNDQGQPKPEHNESCKCNLGYRFYLKKAHILVATQELVRTNDIQSGPGIEVIDRAKFEKDVNTRNFPHTFGLIVKSSLPSESKPELLARLPILRFDSLDQSNSRDIEERLAEAWLNRVTDGKTFTPILVSNRYHKAIFGKVQCDRWRPNGNAEQCLVFDHHNELLVEYVNPGEFAFYEPHGSQDPQHGLLLDTAREKLYAPLFTAAALCHVVLLDERVQANAEKQTYRGITSTPIVSILDWMRVKMPLRDICNLDNPDVTKINEWIGSLCSNKLTYPFFVIHQGIIDKLRKANGGFDDTLSEWVKQVGADDRLIVCSGRGSPREALPKPARFVPVSAILEWTLNRPSKFHLVYLLVHARRP